MACSDYLALKKQKTQICYKPYERISSNHTQNNQYCNLQNIENINEDGDIVQNTRFNIPITNTNTKIYSKYNNTLASRFSTMYSIPKIHTAPYIKNRYEPAFCWTCWTPTGEIVNSIACSVCDYTNEFQPLDNTSYSFINSVNDNNSDLENVSQNINISEIIYNFENSDLF